MSSPPLEDALVSFPAAELRRARDTDADGLIALVSEAYGEYPGCVLDLPGVDNDLVAPATSAAEAGSTLWVVDDGGHIVASVGAGRLSDAADPAVELKRLYVAGSHRRRGLAAGLVSLVEEHAVESGARIVDLWSDTRFSDAHRLYERLGYRRTGRTRHLDDPSDTTELHFQRTVGRQHRA